MTDLDKWKELYEDAVSKRKEIDGRFKRRNELYKGTSKVINRITKGESDRPAYCFRNMCFELVETQINNSIPQPKVTARDTEDTDLACMTEDYLKLENDRLDAESMNDVAERATYKQGSVFYQVDWDSTKNTPTTSGELVVKVLGIDKVYPQPGIKNIKDAEYIFTKELVSVKKLERLYKVKDIPECGDYKGMNYLITAWYYDDNHHVAKFGWVEDKVIFDLKTYQLRKLKVCSKCHTPFLNNDKCPLCENKTYTYIDLENETATEDIVKGDPNSPDKPEVLVRKGGSIPYYQIDELPFVLRCNISDTESLYGISDIDVLEENQQSSNKVLTKIEENILKGGSIVTTPPGVNIPKTDETLKIVKVKDPNLIKSITVQTMQANTQQDMILGEHMYQMGRDVLGITDSFQGKRDTTAESGKAKQVAAAQATGRLESKKRMKEAAYADLYRLMFKFLLAYCDEPRKFSRMLPDGSFEDAKFSKYNFLNGVPEHVFYNDRFLFSVDSASVLSTNRIELWRETANNLAMGTYGNPADPNTLILYWNIMKDLNYPLAKYALANLQERKQQLPIELQQAIMQNPEILGAVQEQLQGVPDETKK